MGIRGLTLLATHLKQRRRIGFSDIHAFRNEAWAIDASLFMYRARTMCALNRARRASRFRNIASDVPLDKSHLVGIVDLVSQLLTYKIKPVLVFDGEPPVEKNDTIHKRRLEKIKLQRKIEWVEKNILQSAIPSPPPPPPSLIIPAERSTKIKYADVVRIASTATLPTLPTAGVPPAAAAAAAGAGAAAAAATISPVEDEWGLPPTPQEIEDIRRNLEKHKQQASAVYLDATHVHQTQALCDILGILYHQSTGEAEVACAGLQRSGCVQSIYTADSDVLVFGCDRMIRKIVSFQNVDAMHYSFIAQELHLTHEQFVRFCILMGCDFCDGVVRANTGITPHTILQLVRNPELQGLHVFERFGESMGDEWVAKAKRAYEIYTQPIEPVHIPMELMPAAALRTEDILRKLKECLGMDEDYTRRVVEQYVQAYNAFANAA